MPLPILPAAEQFVTTGPDGRCVLGIDDAVRGTPFVTVTSPDALIEITGTLELVNGEMLVDLAMPMGS
jgi:hypothetical protein